VAGQQLCSRQRRTNDFTEALKKLKKGTEKQKCSDQFIMAATGVYTEYQRQLWDPSCEGALPEDKSSWVYYPGRIVCRPRSESVHRGRQLIVGPAAIAFPGAIGDAIRDSGLLASFEILHAASAGPRRGFRFLCIFAS
jgi:hypothetical protein